MNCRPASRLGGALLAVAFFCATPATGQAQVVYDFWTSMFGPSYYYTGYGYGYGNSYSSWYGPSYNTAWYPSTGSCNSCYSAAYVGNACGSSCGTGGCGYGGCGTSCWSPCDSPCGSSCGSSCNSCGFACAGGDCAGGNCASGDCASGDCDFQPPRTLPSDSGRGRQPTPARDNPPRTYDDEPRSNPADEGFAPRRNDRDSDSFPGAPPADDFRTPDRTPETEIRRREPAPVDPPRPENDITRRRRQQRLAARPLNLDQRQTAWRPVPERSRLHAVATFKAPRVARTRVRTTGSWTVVADAGRTQRARTHMTSTRPTRTKTSRLDRRTSRTR